MKNHGSSQSLNVFFALCYNNTSNAVEYGKNRKQDISKQFRNNKAAILEQFTQE
jgi:hypothetical protein